MNHVNPFAVSPYDENKAGSFHGREREVRALLGRVESDRVVLVHAQMGAGKSSLVQAGVVRPLKASGFLVGDVLRPGDIPQLGNKAGGILSSADILRALLKTFDPDAADSAVPDAAGFVDACREAGSGESVAIVIDQLEEIFTRSHNPVHDAGVFFSTLGELAKDPELWIILIVRDDYLGRTLANTARMPGIREARFAVPLLSSRVAGQIIRKTLGVAEDQAEPKIDALVTASFLAGLPAGHAQHLPEPDAEAILPLFLQVVCHSWFKLSSAGGRIQAQEGLASILDQGVMVGGDFGSSALVDFVDSAFRQAVQDSGPASRNDALESTLRQWCEDEMVENGTRVKAPLPETIPPDKDRLCQGYLLSVTAAPHRTVELAHDSFVPALMESNRKWFRNRGDLGIRFREWTESDKSPAHLLTVREYLRFRHRVSATSGPEVDFLAASKHAIRNSLLGISLIALLVSGVGFAASYLGARTKQSEIDSAKAEIADSRKVAEQQRHLASLRMGAILQAQASWFSAMRLRDDDQAMAQAVRSNLLALEHDRKMRELSAQRPDVPLEQEAAPFSLSTLSARLSASSWWVRRRLLPKTERPGMWQFTPAGLVSSCGEPPINPLEESGTAALQGDTDCESAPVHAGQELTVDGVTFRSATDHHVPASDGGGGPGPRFFSFVEVLDPGRVVSRPLVLDQRSVATVRAGNTNVRSSEATSEIALSRLVFYNDVIYGLTILRKGGMAYVWSVPVPDARRCLAGPGPCEILRLETAERAMGGRPMDAWLQADAGGVKLRMVSMNGEWTEIRKPQSARAVISPGNRRAVPADLLLIEGKPLLATNSQWCFGSGCGRDDGFVHFAGSPDEATFPRGLLMPPGTGPFTADRGIVAVAKDGRVSSLDLDGLEARPGNAIPQLPGEIALMLRLPGSAAALAYLPEAPTSSRLTRIEADAGGNARHAGTVRGSERIFELLKDARIKQWQLSESGVLGIAATSAWAGDGRVLACQLGFDQQDVDVRHCADVSENLSRGPTAVAVSEASELTPAYIAVGSSVGDVVLLSLVLAPDGSFSARSVMRYDAHAGEVSALEIPVTGGGVRILSGGRDGAVLMLDVDRNLLSGDPAGTGDAGEARGSARAPMTLHISRFPIAFIRRDGDRVLVAATDSSLVAVETAGEALIAAACRSFDGTYPAQKSRPERLDDVSRQFADIGAECRKLVSAASLDAAGAESQ